MKSIRLLLSLALFGLLAACVTGGEAYYDADSRADFSHYRTFAFSQPLGTNRGEADTLLSQRLKAATARQMQARGFVYQERDPDLLIDFHARVEEHEYADPMFNPMFGYYYPYHGRFYRAWPSWGWGFGMDSSSYREGKLNIDMIDADQRKLIWEAVVTSNAVRATGPRADALVDAAVATAFRRFPVAGPVPMPAPH